jgi:hypothetical protein
MLVEDTRLQLEINTIPSMFYDQDFLDIQENSSYTAPCKIEILWATDRKWVSPFLFFPFSKAKINLYVGLWTT